MARYGPIFTEPQPAAGYTLIDVRAAAISHVVKGRASGRHYSFDGTLPFVVGIDGVGMTSDGQRVYFCFPQRAVRQYGATRAGRAAELPAAAGCT